jgi:hypothetical protein
MFNHPNLPAPFVDIAIPLSEGQCKTLYHSDRPADTAMMGVLAAGNKDFGITGVAPAAQVGSVEFDWAGPDSPQIQRLFNVLKPGDVVVVRGWGQGLAGIGDLAMFPSGTCPQGNAMCTPLVERYGPTSQTIRQLIDEKLVHVVLDAGRGGVNLDDERWEGLFSRENDSGAIYVGSVNVKTGRRDVYWDPGVTTNNGNYGSRIDLAGWNGQPPVTADGYPWRWTTDCGGRGMSATCGTPIFTYHGAGYQNGYDEQNGYQPYYYNLSVPQVAGIVALVQSVAFADKRIGKPLPPRYLRQLLVRTAHELPLNDPDKPIGKYPDAGAAVEGLMQDLADGTLQRAFEEAGWPSDPDTPETSEPITGNVTIPGEVDAGETFTVSIDAAQSTSGKALSYEWKWMGVATKPEGDKFIAQGSNKAPSMTIKAGEFDDDVPAYIRVVVSDGENERSFMQDVRIKAKRANPVA